MLAMMKDDTGRYGVFPVDDSGIQCGDIVWTTEDSARALVKASAPVPAAPASPFSIPAPVTHIWLCRWDPEKEMFIVHKRYFKDPKEAAAAFYAIKLVKGDWIRLKMDTVTIADRSYNEEVLGVDYNAGIFPDVVGEDGTVEKYALPGGIQAAME